MGTDIDLSLRRTTGAYADINYCSQRHMYEAYIRKFCTLLSLACVYPSTKPLPKQTLAHPTCGCHFRLLPFCSARFFLRMTSTAAPSPLPLHPTPAARVPTCIGQRCHRATCGRLLCPRPRRDPTCLPTPPPAWATTPGCLANKFVTTKATR